MKIIKFLPLIPLLCGCAKGHTNTKESSINDLDKYGIDIRLDQLEDDYEIHTDEQIAFLELGTEYMRSYGIDGRSELSRPLPVSFSWKTNVKEGTSFDRYILNVSENEDMSDAWSYRVNKRETGYDVYNLKIGTRYYYSIETTTDKGEHYTSEVKTFVTAATSPRNLYIEGITNARDLGGWMIDEHHRVKQGLLYRTGRFNRNSVSIQYNEISDEGIEQLADYLGVQTEIDLRRVDINEVGSYTKYVLGEGSYYSCPINYDDPSYLSLNRETIKQIFELLCDTDNYPICYHCSIGTDRTGFISYMVNGLLGVDLEDLFVDYEFSNLANIDGNRYRTKVMDTYVKAINQFDGDTLSERIKNCLLDLGISQGQIDTLINFLTETI